MPVFIWGIMAALLCLASLSLWISAADDKRPGGLPLIMAVSGILFAGGILLRFLRSLQFREVPTALFLSENMEILEQFLESEHLLVFRHPHAPEVYQIISRNISAGKEDREIMIFIADDHRILINSHFTNAGWGMPAQGHSRAMAARLSAFAGARLSQSRDIRK